MPIVRLAPTDTAPILFIASDLALYAIAGLSANPSRIFDVRTSVA